MGARPSLAGSARAGAFKAKLPSSTRPGFSPHTHTAALGGLVHIKKAETHWAYNLYDTEIFSQTSDSPHPQPKKLNT